MLKKESLRKKYFLKRKKNYFQINDKFFLPLIKLIKKNTNLKIVNISIYYPSLYEVNILKIFEIEYFGRFSFFLPIVEKNDMSFHKWDKNDVLFVNKYGIPEPKKSVNVIPSLILVPLLAFDEDKNRLGYGKGFYDKFLNKYLKINKKILTVGVAFSFQKYHKLPIHDKDFKLDFIITEKGLI
tara:strand:+ start:786 stop:1334 length:549 start_codon:yes stop_codon:yes gene_type:complete